VLVVTNNSVHVCDANCLSVCLRTPSCCSHPPQVSIVAEQLLRLLHHCGMPRTDADLIHGGGQVVNELLLRAQPRSTLFTGSQRVAEKLAVDMKGKVRGGVCFACCVHGEGGGHRGSSVALNRCFFVAAHQHPCNTPCCAPLTQAYVPLLLCPASHPTSPHCTSQRQVLRGEAGYDWKVLGPGVSDIV
jgi:hypothetical protein